MDDDILYNLEFAVVALRQGLLGEENVTEIIHKYKNF